MLDASRTEQVLDQAVAAGKIPPDRKPYYRQLHERDPAGTERLLASLAPGLLPSAPAGPVQAQHPHPVTVGPAAEAEINPEDVARWTGALFPETRQRGSGRVIWAD